MTRIAVIEQDKCINGKGCPLLCASLCPVNRAAKDCIVEGENKKPVIDVELCIGCGICVHRCPTSCISIVNLPSELDKPPVHQYGKNGFHLYNLPIPIFGKVVGIIGKNGIGKTTALKILAGLIKPNLGEVDSGPEGYKDIIKFFKGTEAQNFFEKLESGEITVAYKPQQVDLIPQQAKGSVAALLKKVDETGKYDEVVKLLDVEHILDNNIAKLSGGELQRVAIAATVLKKANFYVFDEPTSYLDIKQRMRVAKFIRSLATPETAVMVIEHDLIILDYMTDLMHLMYGKESVYGVVSQTKSTKEGINTYLGGYLKEENVRFRDKPIKFEVRMPEKAKETFMLTSWNDIQAKFGKFSLKAAEGEVNKKDVIGVLGENGIGKTSFVKILAGVEKPLGGSIGAKVKVSYKPQYLENVKNVPVAEALKECITKYSTQIAKPLQIEPLLTRNLNELSGGELQRVAIAHALAQKADLYLFDEPSAYLDVEQRLIVSKVIRDIMDDRGASAIIVDHDLLFLDYLSKKLMVFDGQPAVKGEAKGPFTMQQGMTMFLEDLAITMRRDPENHRPRVNKLGSVKDREQKASGKYYYT